MIVPWYLQQHSPLIWYGGGCSWKEPGEKRIYTSQGWEGHSNRLLPRRGYLGFTGGFFQSTTRSFRVWGSCLWPTSLWSACYGQVHGMVCRTTTQIFLCCDLSWHRLLTASAIEDIEDIIHFIFSPRQSCNEADCGHLENVQNAQSVTSGRKRKVFEFSLPLISPPICITIACAKQRLFFCSPLCG